MEKNSVRSSKRVSTGVDGLDFILGGGVPAERLYLLQGNPGTGKTTIGLQFLLEGARKGEKGLYITLSESKEELTSVADSHGWDISGIEIYDLTVSGDSLQSDSHYTVFHPSEVELDETTRAVLSEIERTNAARVVFDSLSEMRMLASDSLRFRRQILALKQYFLQKLCTVVLIDDRTTANVDRQLESIAHGVINLDYIPPEYGRQRHSIRVVKMRGVNFQSGAHDYNIETGGVIVFPRLGSLIGEHRGKSGTLYSGLEALDTLVGGLDYGTSTIVIGPAGIGKSTLSVMYAYSAALQGEKVSIYLFDEQIETLYIRTAKLGLDIKPLVESGQIILRQIRLAEVTPGELAHAISREVEADGVKVVLIDSVNGYLMSMPQERSLVMQFHELLSYLNRNGVVSILMVSQYGMIGQMTAPIDMSYLADTVILLRYFEAEGAVKQAISVLKKRTGEHERTIREFSIGEKGIRLGAPLVDFHGVLTGIPTFKGKAENLMHDRDDSKK